MTYSRFMELFPDNDACLEYLKERFFSDGTECPKCGKASKFHRITGRSAEHEHIWFEGLETRCALPLDGFEQATHREMLDEFCKRARIDFRPEYRDPVKGVQLQI